MKTKTTNIVIGKYHLLIGIVFLIAFLIRVVGSTTVNLNQEETQSLIAAVRINTTSSSTFLDSLIINCCLKIGLNVSIALRLINALVGSLIVLLPVLFIAETGKKPALLISIFFAFDPFAIVNSIIFTGNSFILLMAGLLLDAIIHKRKHIFLIVLFMSFFSARGLGYFILISLIWLIFLFLFDRKMFFQMKLIIEDNLISISEFETIIGVFSAVLVLISFISGTPLSNMFSEPITFSKGWLSGYQKGNFPIVFIFAIFSYIPLALLTFLFSYPKNIKKISRRIKNCVTWIICSFIIVTIYPAHWVGDLIWVSVPLGAISGILIRKYLFDSVGSKNIYLPYFAILISLGISISYVINALAYRYIWGLEYLNLLITILVACIFVGVLVIYHAYVQSVPKALLSLSLVLLVLLGTYQVSTAMRSAGFNQKPENEILWNGYFQDRDIVNQILETTKTNLFGTNGQLTIYMMDRDNTLISWLTKDEKLLSGQVTYNNNIPDIIFSENEMLRNNKEDYQGQIFIENSYPLWTWDPMSSVVSGDFWNWILFRNSQQYTEYNSVWINRSALQNQVN